MHQIEQTANDYLLKLTRRHNPHSELTFAVEWSLHFEYDGDREGSAHAIDLLNWLATHKVPGPCRHPMLGETENNEYKVAVERVADDDLW